MQAGLFFVKKPEKEKCRVIVDARQANRAFARPPTVELASFETFARLEVELPSGDLHEERVPLTLGMCDIKDAFHRFRLREGLARYFGVGRATAKELHLVGTVVSGNTLLPDDAVYLAWASLPMGFSWSLYFCQRAGESIVGGVPGLQFATRLCDRGPPGVLRGEGFSGPQAFYVYVDNVGLAGTVSKSVEAELENVVDAFSASRLVTHEESISTQEAKALGTRLDLQRNEATLAPKRVWRVVQAVRYALRLKTLPGRVWEILVGHLTFCGQLDRSSLSRLSSSYAFMQKNYDVHVRLWTQAELEVKHMVALLPYLAASWVRPWVRRLSAPTLRRRASEPCGIIGPSTRFSVSAELRRGSDFGVVKAGALGGTSSMPAATAGLLEESGKKALPKSARTGSWTLVSRRLQPSSSPLAIGSRFALELGDSMMR